LQATSGPEAGTWRARGGHCTGGHGRRARYRQQLEAPQLRLASPSGLSYGYLSATAASQLRLPLSYDCLSATAASQLRLPLSYGCLSATTASQLRLVSQRAAALTASATTTPRLQPSPSPSQPAPCPPSTWRHEMVVEARDGGARSTAREPAPCPLSPCSTCQCTTSALLSCLHCSCYSAAAAATTAGAAGSRRGTLAGPRVTV
jgi:hypothetical protein